MTISNMYQTSPLHIRSLVAGFAGNILEWYDFTVYAYFATVIGKHFFPSDDKIASLIAAFGVFAAGYLMRPLGGFLFGVIGDKMGRKRALVLSILFMAIPTTLLGCLPTHAQWGWVSAALLVLLRLFQGLSVGGEFTGSISFLVEKAREGKRGFYGSWSTFGVIGGMLLGSGVGALITTILSPHQINQFGWRIPFLLGFVVGVAGLYLRKGMDQGDVVETLRQTDDLSQSPVREFLKMHLNTGARIFFFNWGFAVSIYMVFVYLTAFLHSFLNVPMHRALTANTLSMLVMMCLIPLMGMLSDRFGRKPMLLWVFQHSYYFRFPFLRFFSIRILFPFFWPCWVLQLWKACFKGWRPLLWRKPFHHEFATPASR